jgi:rubredoxin
MKCICGYEYEMELTNNNMHLEVIKGDKPFIKITVTTLTGFGEIDFFTCPKCGTVKVEV